MAEASISAFMAALGVAIALAIVCFALRGKGHPDPIVIEEPRSDPPKPEAVIPKPPPTLPKPEAVVPKPEIQEYEHQFEHYCVKCKTRRWIENPQEKKLKNGRDAVSGNCTICGIKVFRIGKMPEGRKVPKSA